MLDDNNSVANNEGFGNNVGRGVGGSKIGSQAIIGGQNYASGNQNQNNNLQITEDDINLGNRRMVLNFGEKPDEIDTNDVKGSLNPDSELTTPSVHGMIQQQEIDVYTVNESQKQPVVTTNNYFQHHRGSDSSAQ